MKGADEIVERTIKEMSEATGIPADTLRYYDKLGIVSPKRRTNGYRTYNEIDYIYLQYVTVMKYANFSLGEIRLVIRSMSIKPSPECNRINRDLVAGKREELTARIRNYRKIILFIDMVLPMIHNHDDFAKNEEELDRFVDSVYQDIMRSGGTA
jgi:MerR family copper efflux transcriptional regulator